LIEITIIIVYVKRNLIKRNLTGEMSGRFIRPISTVSRRVTSDSIAKQRRQLQYEILQKRAAILSEIHQKYIHERNYRENKLYVLKEGAYDMIILSTLFSLSGLFMYLGYKVISGQ
jgi:hypothetical protein